MCFGAAGGKECLVNMKRIVHCMGQLNTGGAETLVMNILRNIDRDKFQFDFLLFSEKKGFYDKEAKELGANLFYTPSISKVGLRKYINDLISFFKNQEIDVVHSHMDWQGGFIAYAASKANVKKIVVHSHANQKMFDSNIVYHLMIKLNQYLIKKYATDCIACSNEAGESLFVTKKYKVLYNGIDLQRFIKPNSKVIKELKEEFDIKDNDIILGHVGSFSVNKNQSFLIDVLNELVKMSSNYKLILVGEGNTKEKIYDKVRSLALEEHVIFTGVRSEIPEIMHLFDVFLFPSFHEGLGIVAIEAQASGLSCIISDTIPKEVDLNMGLIHQIPLDKNKWKEAILKNKPIDINNNLLYNSRFNIDYTIRELTNIYLK